MIRYTLCGECEQVVTVKDPPEKPFTTTCVGCLAPVGVTSDDLRTLDEIAEELDDVDEAPGDSKEGEQREA